MRTYFVHATRAHFKVTLEWPMPMWRSRSRIRPFTTEIFKNYFGGRQPTGFWHKDGFMAEAWDRRGNHISVSQENWFHPYNSGATTMRRPCCPALRNTRA